MVAFEGTLFALPSFGGPQSACWGDWTLPSLLTLTLSLYQLELMVLLTCPNPLVRVQDMSSLRTYLCHIVQSAPYGHGRDRATFLVVYQCVTALMSCCRRCRSVYFR